MKRDRKSFSAMDVGTGHGICNDCVCQIRSPVSIERSNASPPAPVIDFII